MIERQDGASMGEGGPGAIPGSGMITLCEPAPATVAVIELTRGLITRVDEADLPRLAAYSWHATPSWSGLWYAQTKARIEGRRRTILLHRLLLDLRHGDPRQVDHIDGYTLNNVRSNLRVVNRNQQQQNKRKWGAHRYKGTQRTASGRWAAHIKPPERGVIHLGTFDTEIEAALAYDVAAIKLFGEYARLNFGGSHADES